MNKLILSLVVALIAGCLLTLASYFVTTKGVRVVCAPANGGSLDELYGVYRKEHGFPLAYYSELPQDCAPANQPLCGPDGLCGTCMSLNSPECQTSAADMRADTFDADSFFKDLVLWFGASLAVAVLIVQPSRRKK